MFLTNLLNQNKEYDESSIQLKKKTCIGFTFHVTGFGFTNMNRTCLTSQQNLFWRQREKGRQRQKKKRVVT